MYKSEVDASLVLANALQEIDGIIAETEMELKNSFENFSKKDRFNNLLEELIEITKEENVIEIESRKNLIIWLRELNRQTFNKENNGSISLNNFKTSLLESELSVLKEQVEAQQDKIKEFEVKISELQAMLVISENSYQEVFKQKFKVEDEKFNLINELSRIKTINDDKIRLLESEISFLKKTLLERETETASLRLYLAKIVRASNHLLTENESDSSNIFSKSSDSIKLNDNRKVILDKPPIVPRNHFISQNQQQFKDSSLTGSFTMPSTTSNKVKSFNKNNIHARNEHSEKSYSSILNNRCLSPINRLDLATSKEQIEQFCNKETHDFYDLDKKNNANYNSANNYLFFNQSPSSTCSTSNRSAKSNSSPLSSQNNTLPKLNNSGNYSSNLNSYLLFNSKAYPKSSSISNDNFFFSKYKKNSSFKKKSYSLNLDSLKNNFSQTNLYTSPSIVSNYSYTLDGSIRDIVKPRPLSFSSLSNSRNFISSIGRNFWFKKTLRSSSAPELADDSKLSLVGLSENSNSDLLQGFNIKENDFINKDSQKTKGLKWFFDKVLNKSQNNNELSFSRTSLRATTGPQIRNFRLKQDMNIDFKKWNSLVLCDWISSIGLGNYSEFIFNSNLNGEKLLNLNDVQLEKILQIKNHFHRKKLKLAIQSTANKVDNLTLKASKLDYLWVAKWLDDIGLPQYKEIFLESRIDGSVLHYLTTEDLCKLKINTQLHHSSIKTGIFVLRKNNFDPNCLKRRASPENSSFSYDCSKSNDSNNSIGQLNLSSNENEKRYNPEKVELWTLHRVMEWLRSIDLSEFVANLRGSGVHGSLFINEDCFNSNVLATLLSIPPSKTLLRRHINTYFNQLVGNEISLRKREYQERLGPAQLSAFTKIRLPKKSNFRNSFRKKKNEIEDDLVCPITFPLNNINNENQNNLTLNADTNVSKESYENSSANQSLSFSNKSFLEKNKKFDTNQNNSNNENFLKENMQSFLEENYDNSSVNEPESHV